MPNNAKQHIFFVDDEPKIRDVVGETLEEIGSEVSCFACAADCLEELGSKRCDLLIADVRMPEMDGMELLAKARSLAPWLPILIITGYGDIPMAVSAIKAGAVDFIEKPLDKKSFLWKVKTILQQNTAEDAYKGRPLTDSEMKVLKLIIDGKSNKQIAQIMHRSIRTIEVHRGHLMSKLDVDNVVDLVKRAAMMGLVELPSREKHSNPTQNAEEGL